MISRGHCVCWCLWGKAKSKICILRAFLKITVEMVPKGTATRVKSPCACVGLTLKRIVWSMIWKAAERSSKVKAMTLPSSIDDRISLRILRRVVQLREVFNMQTDNDWICLNYLWFAANFCRTLERNLRLDTGRCLFMSSLLRVGFFNRGEIRADMMSEGMEPSESDNLNIDAMGVTRMSIQSATMSVGNGSKSETLHGTNRTDEAPHHRWHKWSSVRPSWYQEDSTHSSISQRRQKSKRRKFNLWKRSWKYLLVLQ